MRKDDRRAAIIDEAIKISRISGLMFGLEAQWLRENCGFDLVAE